MKLTWNLCSSCLLLLVLQICFCSLPSDIEPVNWKMHFEVPITNKRYGVRHIIKDEYTGEMDVKMGKADTIGDTVFIYKKDFAFYEISKELITTDTSVTEEKVGAVTLNNTPAVDIFFEFPGVSGLPGPVTLPAELSFTKEEVETLDEINSVTIDESSPVLKVSVKNISLSADVERVKVILLNEGTAIDSSSLATLPAGAEVIAPFEIQGKSVYSPLTVRITATIPSGTQLRANEGLRVFFNLDDMIVSDAVVVDSLIDYTDSFDGAMGLTDSIDINFIDLDSALISCQINNPCAFKIEFTGIIEDAWNSDFAKVKNLRSIDQLRSIKDSSAFAGRVIDDTLFKAPGTTRYEKVIPLKKLRLFPTWDTDSAKSTIKFRYILRSLSDGRWIHFNKNDLISFRLVPTRFPFVQISGKFAKPMTEFFSSEQKIGFDWDSTILNSLRKSFRFESVQMNLSFVPVLVKGSYLDSMKMHLKLAEKNNAGSTVVLDKKFIRIAPDSQHTAVMQISPLINTWPDTLAFSTQITLPEGTGVELYNSKDPSGQYSTNFSIGINVEWNIKIALAWKVLDTIRTELDLSSFSLDEDLEWIGKIKSPEITLDVKALNNTNLHFVLFALGDTDKQKLLEVPDSLLYSYSPTVDTGSFFRLFGLQGLNVPPRGNVDSIKVKLDHRAIDALISKNKCHIRWFLIIPSADPDVLLDTDFIDVKAKAVIEGIGNSDSLLYWR